MGNKSKNKLSQKRSINTRRALDKERATDADSDSPEVAITRGKQVILIKRGCIFIVALFHPLVLELPHSYCLFLENS